MTDKIAELEQKLSDLQAELAALKSAPASDKWPKEGDKYWCAGTRRDDVGSFIWVDDDFDNSVREWGNCFRTREEARRYGKYLVIKEKLRTSKGARKFVVGGKNWAAWYNHYLKLWEYHNVPLAQRPDQIYFNTEENCRAAYDALTDREIYLNGGR